MRYIDEFRNGTVAKVLAHKIAEAASSHQHYKLMEFCGGHTHAIYRYGIPSLLPKNVEMIHGPGCPVCVLPIGKIDQAIALAQQPNVIFCSYADMLRVPGTNRMTLLKAKAQGADIRMIYSAEDALNIARHHPDKQIIFFAIGFETTTPPTAIALQVAKREQLQNFSVFCNHVLTPVAMAGILTPAADGQIAELDGFVGPSHVSIIIGSNAYDKVAQQFHKPIVISGFEPLDVLQSILMLIDMINAHEVGVKNQYTRAVTAEGNIIAQQAIADTLELRDQFEWRGLGSIPKSALKINAQYSDFDAEQKFPIVTGVGQEHKACDCPAILRGLKKPADCKLFATACTPENPLGSCMVSSEGACAAYYAYGRTAQSEKVMS